MTCTLKVDVQMTGENVRKAAQKVSNFPAHFALALIKPPSLHMTESFVRDCSSFID